MSLSSQGFQITPSAAAVTEAQAVLVAAYGSNVNLTPAGPNGQLIQAMAMAITMRENEEAETVNSLNPNIAAGQQLDAICANLNLERVPAVNSTATCTFTGLTGVSITAGSQVQSTAGDIFTVDITLVIGALGTITGTVTAVAQGPIAVTADTITTVLTQINGWDTVNNPSDGSVGTPAQSDVQLRTTRLEALAFASSGSIPSMNAGAAALNPISYYVYNNKIGTPVVKDGLTINGNSMMLIIDGGGSDLEIATMIYDRLSGGCGMSGNTSYDIVYTILSTPQVFTAKWQTATREALGLNIQLKLGIAYAPEIVDVITAIVNDNLDFNRIGKLIYSNEFVDLLINNGVTPIISLTFNIGATTGLTQYTMPISQSIGGSMLSSNVTVSYV